MSLIFFNIIVVTLILFTLNLQNQTKKRWPVQVSPCLGMLDSHDPVQLPDVVVHNMRERKC